MKVSYLHLIPAAQPVAVRIKEAKRIGNKGNGEFFGSLEAVTDDVVKIAKSF
jgi:hypothetical protein